MTIANNENDAKTKARLCLNDDDIMAFFDAVASNKWVFSTVEYPTYNAPTEPQSTFEQRVIIELTTKLNEKNIIP